MNSPSANSVLCIIDFDNANNFQSENRCSLITSRVMLARLRLRNKFTYIVAYFCEVETSRCTDTYWFSIIYEYVCARSIPNSQEIS